MLLTAVLLVPFDVARLARYVSKRFFAKTSSEKLALSSAGNDGAQSNDSQGHAPEVVPRRAFLEQAGVTGREVIQRYSFAAQRASVLRAWEAVLSSDR